MRRVGRDQLWLLSFLVLGIILTGSTHASEPTGQHTEDAHHEEFEPGTFIFDHIGDSYDWHIIDLGNKSVSIPLPVILISKNQGLVVFMSSKFQHGHSEYRNFNIAGEGEHEGTIVEKMPDGSVSVPFDISITKNIASLFISILIILLIFVSIGNAYKKNPLGPPRGLQSLLEPVILFIRDEVAVPSIGKHKYESFMPFLLTVFFFIWINNMLGLVPIFPGGANVTGNIAVTLVLAFFTFVITTISGNKNYWTHIFNTPGVPAWLKLPLPIMPVVEAIGIFTKPIVLMIRLFANITAGHIIVLGFLSLIFLFGQMQPALGYGVSVVSVAFMMFMTLLELLVAFIQAYVFTFLSALYIGMAVEEHH